MEARCWNEDPRGDAALDSLFDPDRPVPEGTTLVLDRDAADLRLAARVYRFGAGVFGIGALALGSAAPEVWRDPWVFGRGLYAAVIVGLLYIVVAFVRAARRRDRAAHEAALGRRRLGAFLREDVLVLRFTEPWTAFTWGGVIPWGLVETPTIDWTRRRSDGHHIATLLFRFRSAPGAPVQTVELGSFHGADTLCHAVTRRLVSRDGDSTKS